VTRRKRRIPALLLVLAALAAALLWYLRPRALGDTVPLEALAGAECVSASLFRDPFGPEPQSWRIWPAGPETEDFAALTGMLESLRCRRSLTPWRSPNTVPGEDTVSLLWTLGENSLYLRFNGPNLLIAFGPDTNDTTLWHVDGETSRAVAALVLERGEEIRDYLEQASGDTNTGTSTPSA
jgi:hypothetical protein